MLLFSGCSEVSDIAADGAAIVETETQEVVLVQTEEPEIKEEIIREEVLKTEEMMKEVPDIGPSIDEDGILPPLALPETAVLQTTIFSCPGLYLNCLP